MATNSHGEYRCKRCGDTAFTYVNHGGERLLCCDSCRALYRPS